jgi:formylglycine-generating enzyme required for sulfatase activity
MLGNVWEWVEDWYGDYVIDATGAALLDPPGPHAGRERVFRGGCYVSDPGSVRAAYRGRDVPSFFRYFLGFRPARSLFP